MIVRYEEASRAEGDDIIRRIDTGMNDGSKVFC